MAISKKTVPIELSVIISIRITEQRQDIFDRLDFYKLDPSLPESVEFVVVDDGSSDADFKKLQGKQSERVRIFRTNGKYFEDFSLARARNKGAQVARGKFLMIMDADLFPYPGFYGDLMREIRLLKMESHVNRFLMVPVIYATDVGYKEMLDMPSTDWRSYMINAMNSNDNERVEKFSSGTSVIVVERAYYLSRGGQDEDFQGWGYEDYEFNNRLVRRVRMFPLPSNWLSMGGNFMTLKAYDGWKACYRLYGDWLAVKGIYLFHAPHPIEGSYHSRKDQNLKHLLAKMKQDTVQPSEPPPLADPSRGRTLLLRSNPFIWHREFAPFLGHVAFAHEDEFETLGDFISFVRENDFSRIAFPNPYSNEKLQSFYVWCRRSNFPYIVAERGALPDSVYHDETGFLSDGTSYVESKWDNELSPEDRKKTIDYISGIRFSNEMLEAQAPRVDIGEVKSLLKLKRGQRMLLVPFQQPNDTVIKHFAGAVTTFDNFHSVIEKLVERLGSDWLVVYRRHPAEENLLPIPGAVDGSSFNLYDLLELTSAVALINSGVGVYGMMFGKPVYVFGDAWYSHNGLCKQITSTEPSEIAVIIDRGIDIDYERILRFVHYLRFKFYSFGKMKARRVITPAGSSITATNEINYYEINSWTPTTRYLSLFDKIIKTNSPLFDRYRGTAPHSSVTVVPTPPAKKVLIPSAEIHVVEPAPPTTLKPPALPTTLKLTELKHPTCITEGRLAFHQKNYKEAAKLFQQWTEQQSDEPEAYRSAAEAYASLGNIAEARRHILRAKELLPSNKNIKRRVAELRQGPITRLFSKHTPFDIPKP